jgi:hypothetical protein
VFGRTARGSDTAGLERVARVKGGDAREWLVLEMLGRHIKRLNQLGQGVNRPLPHGTRRQLEADDGGLP